MALNKYSKNGATFFQLYISCPVCHDRGLNTPHSFWSHATDGGAIYVSEKAMYECEDCHHTAHVKEWSYNCPTHSGSPDEYVKASSVGLAQAVSTAGQMVNETGVAWLQQFLGNMGEF